MNKDLAKTRCITQPILALIALVVATTSNTFAASPAACVGDVCKFVGVFAPGVLPNDGHETIAHMVDYDDGQWSYNGQAFAQIGGAGWTPMLGDWDGDGFDEPGFHTGDMWLLKTSWTGPWIHGWVPLRFGSASSSVQPLVGDWNGNGIDSFGTYENGLFTLAPDYDNLTTDIRVIDFGAVDAEAATLGASAYPVVGAIADSMMDGVGLVLHSSVQYASSNSSGVYDFASYTDIGMIHRVVPTTDHDLRPIIVKGVHIGMPSETRDLLGFVFAPSSDPYVYPCLAGFDCYSINGPQSPEDSGSVIIPLH